MTVEVGSSELVLVDPVFSIFLSGGLGQAAAKATVVGFACFMNLLILGWGFVLMEGGLLEQGYSHHLPAV